MAVQIQQARTVPKNNICHIESIAYYSFVSCCNMAFCSSSQVMFLKSKNGDLSKLCS